MSGLYRLRVGALVGLLGMQVWLAGCVSIPGDVPTRSVRASATAESSRPTYDVRRGNITQTVRVGGRVAASQEANLYFKQSGRLRKVYVEQNRQVKAHDLLLELETGTLVTQIEQAKLNLEIAEIQLARASENAASEASAASGTKVAEAKALMQKAQADYVKATSDLGKLKAGAAASDLMAAEQAVLGAEAAYQQAQIALAKVKAGAPPEAVRSAEFDLERARNSLWAVQTARDGTCGGGPGPACNAANANVAAAETAVSQAAAALESRRAGPRPEEVAQAEANAASARAAVDSARTRLDQVRAGANPADVAASEQALAAYRAAYDAAKANHDLVAANAGKSGPGSYDIQLQEKQVALARVSARDLEEQLELAQIRAPYDGVVVFLQGREGDAVTAFTPVVTVANPNVLQIAVELSLADLALIKLRQTATVVFPAFPTDTVPATVASLPSSGAKAESPLSVDRSTVLLDFKPPPDRSVQIGDLADVSIVTASRENVLLVPLSSVRTIGDRRFVRVVAPDGKREDVDVELGVSDDAATEIVTGIQQGQKVIGQ